MLFLDINKIKDKTALVDYINEWSKFIEDNCIVPTKADLYSGNYPQFYYEIADLYEREIHIAQPISSKTNLGIEELENQIVRIKISLIV
jgi:translation elongation factor EF-4